MRLRGSIWLHVIVARGRLAIRYLNKEVVIGVEFHKYVGLLFKVILTIINTV